VLLKTPGGKDWKRQSFFSPLPTTDAHPLEHSVDEIRKKKKADGNRGNAALKNI